MSAQAWATDLDTILSEWNLGRVSRLRLLEKGEVNRNIIITAATEKFVLRKVPSYRTEKDLSFEQTYLEYLRTRGFPYEVPIGIPTVNGNLFAGLHGHYYWLYRYVEGRTLAKFDLFHARQVAQMMASYHSLIEKSGLDNGREQDLFNKRPVLKEIRSYRSEILSDPRRNDTGAIFMEESAKLIPLLESMDETAHTDLSRYPIHRDINPENLIWRDQKLVGLVDFENVSSYMEPAVKDIAVTFQHSFRTNGYRLDLKLAKRFFSAYVRSHSVSSLEVSLVPDLMVSGFVEDFAYAYWMMRNDPERAKLRRLKLYSKAAQWNYFNRHKTAEALSHVK